MNLYLRLLITWISCLRAKSQSPLTASTRTQRVLPNDVDLLGHMNNGRFFQVMDVARFDWMLRTGVWRALRSEGWRPCLGGSLVHYRRPLRAFAKYSLKTRLLGYEGPWVLLEHRFHDSNGRLVAVACTRAAMRSRGRLMKGRDVFSTIDATALNLRLPGYVARWLEADRCMFSAVQTSTSEEIAIAAEERAAIAHGDATLFAGEVG